MTTAYLLCMEASQMANHVRGARVLMMPEFTQENVDAMFHTTTLHVRDNGLCDMGGVRGYGTKHCLGCGKEAPDALPAVTRVTPWNSNVVYFVHEECAAEGEEMWAALYHGITTCAAPKIDTN